MSTIFLKTISVLRMAAGVSTLIVPHRVGPLFGLTIGPDASVVARLFGSRDFILGAYLYKTVREWDGSRGNDPFGQGARDSLLSQSATSVRESDGAISATGKADGIPRFAGLGQGLNKTVSVSTVRSDNVATALWLGAACDAIDVVSGAVCFLEGGISNIAAGELVGGAAIFVMAALWQLNVLQRKRSAEQEL
ncbi:hypothetical protein LTR84_011470 [Exophiala bonariae]|uniref:Uncharacterized protein n=1 Tax=Exophiala bonariae TaxID=1690606 RepID=A0AAV9NHF8_9EURO|nr:hypothetical protein LTR84_011470 [Exophiala bonariae]